MTQETIFTVMKQTPQTSILEKELIIAYVLAKTRVFVITHPQYHITHRQFAYIQKLCTKCANGYPLAYITKKKEFYARDFFVDENVLIPRPETETLVDTVSDYIYMQKKKPFLVIDIGTGSGIIAITLAIKHKKKIKVIATDISLQALAIAQKNAKKYKIDHTIEFYQSDLLSSQELSKKITSSSFENIIIVANLPYIDIEIKNDLLQKKESRALYYEPPYALWSQKKGTSHYEKLITQTLQLYKKISNKKQITSFYEIDHSQKEILEKILKQKTSHQIPLATITDFSEKYRVFQWFLK